MRKFGVVVLLSIVCLTVVGQERGAERRAPATSAEGDATREHEAKPPVAEKEAPEEKPVVTRHQMAVGGKPLRYTATVGMMPIKN